MWSLSVISNAGLWISFLLDFSLGLSNSLSKPPGEGLWVECRVGIPKSVYCSMSPNNVLQVQCTSRLISITLKSTSDFYGVLYAGDQKRDCRMVGKGQQKLELSLPVKQCGIITVKSPDEPGKVIHKVWIHIQSHPLIQQDKDQRYLQECIASAEPSSAGEGLILDPGNQKVEVVAPAWMEIMRGSGTDGPRIRGPVVLGETISVLVKANVQGNQDAVVTRCYASDGTSAAPEMLIDERGCPTDTSVVPAFAPVPEQSDKSRKAFWTKFPAFKFPDRNRLYLTCQIVVCDYACPQPHCNGGKISRVVRQDVSPKDGWQNAKVVNQVDVANSVQVVNSDLESQTNTDPYALEEKDDNKICWPLKNLMTAIGILAAILLIALLVALFFWWNRRQRKRREMDDGTYGTQTNSMYNPSTNYYYMDQYGDSQQYSGNGHSTNSNGHSRSESQPQQRNFRSETAA